MIIQMNATVCADMNHGESRRHKIAGSDQGAGCREGRKEGNGLGRRKIRKPGRSAGSSGDDSPTILRRSVDRPVPLLWPQPVPLASVADACVRSVSAIGFRMAVDGSAEPVIFFAPFLAAGAHDPSPVQVASRVRCDPGALIQALLALTEPSELRVPCWLASGPAARYPSLWGPHLVRSPSRLVLEPARSVRR
jgi:hypothetical protein